MREQVIDRLKALALNGISITDELPYEESGVAMYLKNPKRFYVDKTQHDSTPIVQTLGGHNISNNTTSVTVYFSVDAKNSPVQYTNWIDALRGIENSLVLEGTHTRENTITTDYQGDLLVVTCEYRLTRIN